MQARCVDTVSYPMTVLACPPSLSPPPPLSFNHVCKLLHITLAVANLWLVITVQAHKQHSGWGSGSAGRGPAWHARSPGLDLQCHGIRLPCWDTSVVSEPKNERQKGQEFKSISRLCNEFEVSLGYVRPFHKHIYVLMRSIRVGGDLYIH